MLTLVFFSANTVALGKIDRYKFDLVRKPTSTNARSYALYTKDTANLQN